MPPSLSCVRALTQPDFLYLLISEMGLTSVSPCPRICTTFLFWFVFVLLLCAILGLDFIEPHRYGRRADTGDGVDSYDVDISVLRPRTVGYSPGHVRTIAQRAATGPASPGPQQRAGSSAHGSPLDRGSLSASAPRGTSREFPHPGLSSTARRLAYCNALHAAVAAQMERQQQRVGELAEAKEHAALSSEVAEGIGCFEFQLAELKAKGWKGV